MLIERYGLDATKYFLMREFSYGQDAVFSPEGFVERFNFDLCNDLGNLLNRTIGMINKYQAGIVKPSMENKSEIDKNLEEFTEKQIQKVEENMDSIHLSNALTEIWNLIARTNKYIDETAPWILAKNEEDSETLNSVLYHLVENLRKIAIMLNPFMQDTSKSIMKQLGIEKEELKKWDSIKEGSTIEEIHVIEKGEPLFMRLDQTEEVEYIKNEMKK